MKRLPLVLCVLALLGAAFSAALIFRIGRSKQRLETQLSAAHARALSLNGKLIAASTQNAALEDRLSALDRDLGETKSRLTATEARNVQLSRELSQTKSFVTAHDLAERALGQQIETLRHDLADAHRAAVPPGTIEAYRNTVAELERQLANAHHGAAAPAGSGASTAVFATRPAISSSVVSVGPSNAFVVINYGTNRGAATGQTLAILRGTESLASVLISDVRPNFSIAQVRPDSLRGALHKGDSVVLTN